MFAEIILLAWLINITFDSQILEMSKLANYFYSDMKIFYLYLVRKYASFDVKMNHSVSVTNVMI